MINDRKDLKLDSANKLLKELTQGIKELTKSVDALKETNAKLLHDSEEQLKRGDK